MKPFHAPTIALLLVLALSGGCSDDSTTTPPPPDEDPLVAGDITTWAGTGLAGYDGDGNVRGESQFYWPVDIEFTPTIGTYVSDWNNHRIRRLNPDGRFETVVGRSSDGDGPDDPAGVPGTSCELNHPSSVFERSNGKLIVLCWHNHKLREWDPATGKITIVAGRGPGCAGDGGPADVAANVLNQPPRAVEAADGSIYINDQRNQCIRKIDASGVLSTVVATPQCPTTTLLPGGFVDDCAPVLAQINQPTGGNPEHPGGALAIDGEFLYLADTMNHRIRRIDFGADMITTVVGDGVARFHGDGGDPLLASLNRPLDIAFGPDGRLYIADAYNHRVRAVDFTANVITTVAGNGVKGFSGDGAPATSAQLASPFGIGFDADGHLFIADTENNRIRRVLMH
jgi:sugar lactone lactonase YvrE